MIVPAPIVAPLSLQINVFVPIVAQQWRVRNHLRNHPVNIMGMGRHRRITSNHRKSTHNFPHMLSYRQRSSNSKIP